MTALSLLVIAALILFFGAISGRLERTVLTPPMLFVGVGLLICPSVFGISEMDRQSAVLHLVAEITLIVVLFTDAARIDFRLLSHNYSVPVRMLAIGMPLTVAAGVLAAAPFFPEFALVELALLAAVLTPTDAALGQVVVSSKQVPVRVRQGLNVESGLNDGVALPAIVILAALASGHSEGHNWPLFVAQQLILGPLAGVAAGYLGGKLLTWARASKWMNHTNEQLAGISIALLAFSGAEVVHGNGFIAAFVAGLTLGNTARSACTCIYEFAEAEGQLLALLAFLFFGMTMAPEAIEMLNWSTVAYVALSLTVIRMLPVFLSLAGTGLQLPTKLFLGWFGPRGLATILFAILILDDSPSPRSQEIVLVAMTAVLVSIVAHGVTALPLAKAYGAYINRKSEHPHLPELEDAPRLRLRSRTHEDDIP